MAALKASDGGLECREQGVGKPATESPDSPLTHIPLSVEKHSGVSRRINHVAGAILHVGPFNIGVDAMKMWQKVGIGAAAVLVLGGMAVYSIRKSNQGVVTVQTGRVARQDLTSLVTASGEIRPKNYTNVLGEGIGKITDIVVKEGDHVKKGDVLLRLENIQPGADVQAQMAGVGASEASMKAVSASYDSAVATLAQRQADLDKAKLDWQRGEVGRSGCLWTYFRSRRADTRRFR